MNVSKLLCAVPAAAFRVRSSNTEQNRRKNFSRTASPTTRFNKAITRTFANETGTSQQSTENPTKDQQSVQTTKQGQRDVSAHETGRGDQRSLGFVDPIENYLPREMKQLRNQMNRMMRSMDSVFGGFPISMPSIFEQPSLGAFQGTNDFVPKVDVSETDRAVHVHAELPGIHKDNVKISVDNGVLEISGEKQFEKRTEDKKHKFHRVERSYGSFVRRVQVPRSTKATDVKAKFQNGVLEIEVPKVEQPKEEFEVKID